MRDTTIYGAKGVEQETRFAMRVRRLLQWIRARRTEILLFVVLLSCYGYFFPRWADWSQNSRLDLVLAIVDQRTFSIDAYYENTGDYAYYNGRHYTDKAPGASFLAVPFYVVFKTLVTNSLVDRLLVDFSGNVGLTNTLRPDGTGLLPDKVYFSLALSFITFCVVSFPSALIAVLLYGLVGHFSSNKSHQLLVTLAYGVGTIAYPYSGAFYGHQIAAVLLFTAFYILFRKRGALSVTHLFLVGFLLGYSLITEYPVALIAIPLFVYALYLLSTKRQVAWILLGGVGPLVLLMLYDYAAFRTVLPVGYSYSALWSEPHHTGFMSLTYPKLDALWGITFSPFRGLFFLSPWLLLSPAGFWYFRREKAFRAEFLACAVIVGVFLLFNSSSVMWWGGFAVGPRYLVPVLPFLAFPVIFVLNRHGSKPWAKYGCWALVSLSILIVWIEAVSGQSFPDDGVANPLVHYSLPRALSGDIARNFGMLLGLPGWRSLLPLLAVVAGIGWLIGREVTCTQGARLGHEIVARLQGGRRV